ncbi:hypothetical protein [Halobacteriovorax sp. RT-2-4]|uniref:hypothetical protein n=1 Tax=unclassified Halobacteriovorax TaxID=2639665 RepID=UPI003999FB0A
MNNFKGEVEKASSVKTGIMGYLEPHYDMSSMVDFKRAVPVMKSPNWKSVVKGYITNNNYSSEKVDTIEIHYENYVLRVFEIKDSWFKVLYDDEESWVNIIYFNKFIALSTRWEDEFGYIPRLKEYYIKAGDKKVVKIDTKKNHCSGYNLRETTIIDNQVWLNIDYGSDLCGDDNENKCEVIKDIWIKDSSVEPLRGC